MMNMVLFYIACQIVIQGMAYLFFDCYINFPVKNICHKMGVSRKKAKLIYMILGQVENALITGAVILCTARASMVGTANLMASAILSIMILLEAQAVFALYKPAIKQKPLKRKKHTAINIANI